MSSPAITDLVNRYTLNARKSFVCEPTRPCYRYKTCQTCLENKRSFVLQQVSQLYFAWGLDTFLTISFTKLPLHPQEALKHLQKMRRKAFRHIPSGTRYICFMACEIGPKGSNPHLHLLIGAKDHQSYLRVPMKSCATLGIPNFKELEVEDLVAALRIAGYLPLFFPAFGIGKGGASPYSPDFFASKWFTRSEAQRPPRNLVHDAAK